MESSSPANSSLICEEQIELYRSSKRSSKVPKPPPARRLVSTLEEMKQKFFEQYKTTVAAIDAYRETMSELQKHEETILHELNTKNINPTDPHLNVKRIFSVPRSKRAKRRSEGKVSDTEQETSEKARRESESLSHENARNEGNETAGHCDTLSKSEELDNNNFQVRSEVEEGQLPFPKIFFPEELPRNLAGEEFEGVFEEEEEFRHETEGEADAPYVPPSIAQVFL